MSAIRGSFWRRVLRLWPLLLPLVILIPAMGAFLYPPPESSFSDITLAHYPYVHYLRTYISQEFHLPLWSPLFLSGHPMAANPLAGMWYPPGWLALLLPLPLGFNIGVVIHLLWGGIGMYALARIEGRSQASAILVGMAFTALPKLYAHYGAGHLTLLYAVPWTPWLLWAHRRCLERSRWAWGPAVILALIFLADPRWAAYAGALWWLYALFGAFKRRGSEHKAGLASLLPRLFVQTLLAAALAAPLALPLMEFTRYSSRSLMSPEDVFVFSLHPARLLGLVFPDFGGFYEFMLYPGALILLLCLLAFLWRKSLNGAAFWMWSIVLTLLFSLGSYLPLLPSLARLPLFDLLRVPPRALFITGLSMAMLAAHTLDLLLGSFARQQIRSARLLLLSVAAFVFLLSAGALFISGELLPNFIWGGLAVLFAAGWIALRLNERIPSRWWYLVLVVFCLLDWGLVGRSMFYPRQAQDVFSEGAELADYLSRQPGTFRLYSPSYSLPQQTAANFHLQLADGVDPLQLQSYVTFMTAATGVPSDGYSVTLPPFAGRGSRIDNAAYQPDPILLGWMNIRYIAAEFDLEHDGLAFIDRFGDTRLYENKHVLPRAWIQPSSSPIGEDIRPVTVSKWRPERIDISAEGPGLLVLSELAYPGWRVSVDGVAAELLSPADLLRGVQLDSGQHQVVFAFRPTSLYFGLGILGLACGLLFILFFVNRASKTQS